MSQRTAIIDIGSNSARLVIFEKTSRYGFHLICEQKSKVRIGEGSYNNDGNLQPIATKRAYLTLQSFLQTINKYQAKKTICVATSALRDAPNGKMFVGWIKKELKLNIHIIDGFTEAKYGAIAAANLLPITDGITIDIGGGSSDLSLIINQKIVQTYSLNLGTVRLKELFYDSGKTRSNIYKEMTSYISSALKGLPIEFTHNIAIGIGGTARTLSKGIMKRIDYPFDKLHAFTYRVDDYLDYFEDITKSSSKNLKKYTLKKNRFDTIREGTFIFKEILSHIKAKKVITSSVGVREGVYLEQLLKNDRFQFPKEINPSMNSLLDRFKPLVKIEKKRKLKLKIALTLYDLFEKQIDENTSYKKELSSAVKLSSIGKTLTIYKSHQHACYIARHELNYDFEHKEMLLISLLLRMHGKILIKDTLYKRFEALLPKRKTFEWLSFIYTLSIFLHEASNEAKILFSYDNNTLTINSDKPLYLAKEKINELENPLGFSIIIHDKSNLPKHKSLSI